MKHMINTELLELAVNLAIQSVKLRKERSVSIMILAPPEHGKTEIIKKFAFVTSVKIISDFNSFHFADYANDYQSKQKATIMIPDFLKVVNKKQGTRAQALGILNAITEEGWIGKLPMGQQITEPIHANVITALTEDKIRDKRYMWTRSGFMSRFLPLSYKYNDKTKTIIRQYIKDRSYHTDDPIDMKLELDKIDVALPQDIAIKIEKITLGILDDFSRQNYTGFRLQKQLQTLCMASALYSRRPIVNQDDLDTVEAISRHINFDFNSI